MTFSRKQARRAKEAAARRKAWTTGSDSLGDWNDYRTTAAYRQRDGGKVRNWSDVPPSMR
jgi:hypothetical protein